MKLIDKETYERSHPLRMAFIDGKLSMCEQIREIVNMIIINHAIGPFESNTEFEDGEAHALSAIIDACVAFEANADKETKQDVSFDA